MIDGFGIFFPEPAYRSRTDSGYCPVLFLYSSIDEISPALLLIAKFLLKLLAGLCKKNKVKNAINGMVTKYKGMRLNFLSSASFNFPIRFIAQYNPMDITRSVKIPGIIPMPTNANIAGKR